MDLEKAQEIAKNVALIVERSIVNSFKQKFPESSLYMPMGQFEFRASITFRSLNVQKDFNAMEDTMKLIEKEKTDGVQLQDKNRTN